MAKLHKLSALFVGKAGPGFHGDGGNLFLNVTASGAKSWIIRYTSPATGKRRDLGLGPLSTVSLAQARQKAADLRALIATGVDPLDRPSTQRGSPDPIFADLFGEFFAARAEAWRSSKHANQWTATLKTYAPKILALPVSAIRPADIADALRPIWQTKPETARRVRGRIEAVLRFAEAHDYPAKPSVAGRERMAILLGPQKAQGEHHKAAPIDEAPALFQRILAAAKAHPISASAALAIAILTASRSGEIRALTRPEIDLETATITIPGPKMKSGRPHRKPLSPLAVDLLRAALAVPDLGQGVVFPAATGKPLSDMSLLHVLRRLGVDYTAHGWRSTFRDWTAEQTNYPRELAEEQLAHVWADKTEAAYARSDLLDRRRALVNDWAEFLTQ